MQVDYIIVGQGLCGSLLSYYLSKKQCSFVVIDKDEKITSSKIASGVINPITGRRFVKTWRIDEFLPFAVKAYKEIETELNCQLIKSCDILNFHTTQQMKLAFEERVNEEKKYLQIPDKEYSIYFNYNYNIGAINDCWLIDINLFLTNWKEKLTRENKLICENFEEQNLILEKHYVKYKSITAKKLIYCSGIEAEKSSWFKKLPFAANKGEVIVAEIADLPATNIYKNQFSIVPWQNNLFWIGSTYEWKFETQNPTNLFRAKVEQFLKSFVKTEYKIVDHLAAVRPATLERRPFIGWHPQEPKIGIFDGMGTKGCSLSPYFAHQLVENLQNSTAIDREVDIHRFERLLGK